MSGISKQKIIFYYKVLRHKIRKIDRVDLAIRGISAAMKRDAASGNGIDIAVISQKGGWKTVSTEEIEKRIKSMGLK